MLEIVIDNEFDRFINLEKSMCQEYLLILKKTKKLIFQGSKKVNM